MRRVLVIVFHFPPLMEGSGYLRTLKFCEYLPRYGWEPVVLTVHPRAYAYSKVSDERPSYAFPVHRAFALDARRHLSIQARYPSFLATPDRWSTWWLGGTLEGLKMIRRYAPDVIFSTQPIASAHLLGLTLERASKRPWVADFRDPMLNDSTPSEPLRRRVVKWIESRTVARCTRAIFTTPGCEREFALRYPAAATDKWRVVQNGYDEEAFADVEAEVAARQGPAGVPLVLVHSGLLYRDLRDPSALFEALSALKRERVISADKLRVKLRASGEEAHYASVLADKDIDDIVSLEKGVPYRQALAEMVLADGLLLLQGAAANRQIPAKVYEYIRARRPVLALTDAGGDTNVVLREAGLSHIAQIDAVADIKRAVQAFLAALASQTAKVASRERVHAYSRVERTKELAAVLDEAVTVGTHSPRAAIG